MGKKLGAADVWIFEFFFGFWGVEQEKKQIHPPPMDVDLNEGFWRVKVRPK
jgi:hypothetical protein